MNFFELLCYLNLLVPHDPILINSCNIDVDLLVGGHFDLLPQLNISGVLV